MEQEADQKKIEKYQERIAEVSGMLLRAEQYIGESDIFLATWTGNGAISKCEDIDYDLRNDKELDKNECKILANLLEDIIERRSE